MNRKTFSLVMGIAMTILILGVIQFTAPAQASPQSPPLCSLMCDSPNSGACTAYCGARQVITTCYVYFEGPCCYCPPPPGQPSCC